MLDAITCYETTLQQLDQQITDNLSCNSDAVDDMLKLATFYSECQRPLEEYNRVLKTHSSIVDQAKQQNIIYRYSRQLINICVTYGLNMDFVQTGTTSLPTDDTDDTNKSKTGLCTCCMTPFTTEPCCPNCGAQLVNVATRYHTTETVVHDEISQQATIAIRDHQATLKQRRAHFRAFVAQYQAKGSRVIPSKVIAYIQSRLRTSHLVANDTTNVYANVTRAHIDAILRSTKHNNMHKYYKDVARIHAIVTGQKPPDLSHIETRLTLMFDIGFFLLCAFRLSLCLARMVVAFQSTAVLVAPIVQCHQVTCTSEILCK